MTDRYSEEFYDFIEERYGNPEEDFSFRTVTESPTHLYVEIAWSGGKDNIAYNKDKQTWDIIDLGK